MAATYVQSAVHNNPSAGETSFTLALTAVGAGHTLFLVIADATAVPTVTDSAGGVWSQVTSGNNLQLWAQANAASGTHTLTVTWTTTQWVGANLLEYSGMPTTLTTRSTGTATSPKFSLVGSVGAALTGAASAAVTPAWGTSETRAVGNLLILWVSVAGSATLPGTPTGWSIGKVIAGTSCSAAIFYKVAAGTDAAPTVAAITSGIITARLAEFSGNATSLVLDQTASSVGTTSPRVATGGVNATDAELIVTSAAIRYSAAATKTLTDTYDSGVFAAVATNNGGTSTASHWDLAYAIPPSGSPTTPSDSFAFTTTNISGAALVLCTFKLISSPLTATASTSGSATSGDLVLGMGVDFDVPGNGGSASLDVSFAQRSTATVQAQVNVFDGDVVGDKSASSSAVQSVTVTVTAGPADALIAAFAPAASGAAINFTASASSSTTSEASASIALRQTLTSSGSSSTTSTASAQISNSQALTSGGSTSATSDSSAQLLQAQALTSSGSTTTTSESSAKIQPLHFTSGGSTSSTSEASAKIGPLKLTASSSTSSTSDGSAQLLEIQALSSGGSSTTTSEASATLLQTVALSASSVATTSSDASAQLLQSQALNAGASTTVTSATGTLSVILQPFTTTPSSSTTTEANAQILDTQSLLVSSSATTTASSGATLTVSSSSIAFSASPSTSATSTGSSSIFVAESLEGNSSVSITSCASAAISGIAPLVVSEDFHPASGKEPADSVTFYDAGKIIAFRSSVWGSDSRTRCSEPALILLPKPPVNPPPKQDIYLENEEIAAIIAFLEDAA